MNNLMVIDGIEVRRDAYGRYSLNDLHRAAVASGANARTKEPGKFLSSQQTVELVHELTNTQNLGVDPVSVIHGGNERGTYVCKELVYAYAMWISPSFHLKVIRTFDMVTSAPEKLSGQAADKMQAGVILLDFMRRELNLSNSSVLGACQKLQEAVGLPNLAPRYAIDAPADAHDGSSRPTLSLSALLKQYGNRARVRRAFVTIGQRHMRDARRLVMRRARSAPGENPGYQTGRLARSIGYMVPRASKKRAGFMTRIAPNQRNGKGNRMISGDFYPAFLFFGVRGGAKRRRSHHRGASGGSGWRLAPRNNFMVETLEKNRSWTRYFLARELRKSLKPERRHR